MTFCLFDVLLYVHGKRQDCQYFNHSINDQASPRGSLPALSDYSFARNWQRVFLCKRKKKKISKKECAGANVDLGSVFLNIYR